MTPHTPTLKVLRGDEKSFRQITDTADLQDRDIIVYTGVEEPYHESVEVFGKHGCDVTSLLLREGAGKIRMDVQSPRDLEIISDGWDYIECMTNERGMSIPYLEVVNGKLNPHYNWLDAQLTEVEARVERILGRPLK